MRNKITENGTQSNVINSRTSFLSLHSHKRINILHLVLLTTVFILFYTSSSFANRPSMDEDDYDAESAPSSVEMMMQQQSQQSGDVLNLPAQEIQPGETIKIRLLDVPRRGSSMEKVKNEFGSPIATTDGVGKPPITSWTYPDRIVYFEYSTVLHVVAR